MKKKSKKKSQPKQEYWFKRKRFGYGFAPVTWQGWALVTLYVLLMIMLSLPLSQKTTCINDFNKFLIFYIGIIFATTALLVVTFKKSPSVKWRWGKKDTDNPAEDF